MLRLKACPLRLNYLNFPSRRGTQMYGDVFLIRQPERASRGCVLALETFTFRMGIQYDDN